MRQMLRVRVVVLVALPMLLASACEAGKTQTSTEKVASVTTTTPAKVRPSPSPTPEKKKPLNRWVTLRPKWLGTRVLPKRPDGFGEVQPTPPIFRNRRLPTVDLLPPPKKDVFTARIGPVPQDVVERSSWRPKCPVTLDQLSYVTMTFWGFDHLSHTGEMIVNASVAEDVVGVFRKLYEAHFPIEEMRVGTLREQRAPPTGDTDDTSSFECRPVTLGNSWSEHSYGLAIDINPFHNPYVRGDLVAPELAPAYADRSWKRRGMIFEGDVVTQAFDAIGWGWGGRWSSLKDYMHFSQNGH
ncbi:MAG: hypothetical protein QOH90_1242 [Actinomycetota bacterium]|nr:hypothetical protein [Actinomycetota bacterium]